MLHFIPKELPVQKLHQLLIGGVAPRPIALVSTLSKDGIPNLSPFSFFNVFGSNPPILAFSPSRRGRDSSLKDTYHNIVETKECVIQTVTYPMVEQISLASTQFKPELNEFIKSGLTPMESDIVKPFRVKESPFQMECKLLEMKSYGEGGSSANIAICEVLKLHIAEDIFEDGIIHPDLLDPVARMSGNFYSRASGKAIFKVVQPTTNVGIGYDQLPQYIKESNIYSANNLAKFANIESIPTQVEVETFVKEISAVQLNDFELSEEAFFRYQRHFDYTKMFKSALNLFPENKNKTKLFFEYTAKCALEADNIDFAWKAALHSNEI